MRNTIRDDVAEHLRAHHPGLWHEMRSRGFANLGTRADGLDNLIEVIVKRVWAQAADAVSDRSEEWHRDHIRPFEDADMAPEYVHGVLVGLALARNDLGGDP